MTGLAPSAHALEAAAVVGDERDHAGHAAGSGPESGVAEPTASAPPAEVAADEPLPAQAGSAPQAEERAAEDAEPGHSILDAPGRRVGARRPGRYGLSVDFEDRPESGALGRLVESTVLVNTAHPAYLRAVASRSEGYHAALTVAMALAEVAVEPADRLGFVTVFLARWGETIGRDRRRRQPRRRPGATPA